jgi:hypothetical protein
VSLLSEQKIVGSNARQDDKRHFFNFRPLPNTSLESSFDPPRTIFRKVYLTSSDDAEDADDAIHIANFDGQPYVLSAEISKLVFFKISLAINTPTWNEFSRFFRSFFCSQSYDCALQRQRCKNLQRYE